MIFKRSRTTILKEKLGVLIDAAAQFGSPEKDVTYANEFLAYNEYELSLDKIVVQLYEYNLPVDARFCDLVTDISAMMEIPESTYGYIKELLPKQD